MIPAEFQYHSPKTLDEALKLLAEHGDEAKLLAGGHSLIPAMKLRLASFGHLVDLGRISGLDGIKEDAGTIAIGALATHHKVESSELLRSKCPVLSECASRIGDVQVRNRGTIGGSLAHADPAADYPAAIVALEAEIVVRGANGSRTIKAEDFFVDLLTTSLQPGEIVTEVRVKPHAAKTGSAYVKVPQPASGFAIVGVAALVTVDGSGKIASARVGVTGAAAKGYRAKDTEAALAGKGADGIAAAADKAVSGVETSGDLFASAEYRTHLAKVTAKRAIAKALERAGK
ncbi:MAG: FAD binding domain-containing protein [Candidatus Binatia bacterium]